MSNEQEVLMRCYRIIEEAIYDEDGMDGEEGQALLEQIEPLLTDEDRATLAHESTVRETTPET